MSKAVLYRKDLKNVAALVCTVCGHGKVIEDLKGEIFAVFFFPELSCLLNQIYSRFILQRNPPVDLLWRERDAGQRGNKFLVSQMFGSERAHSHKLSPSFNAPQMETFTVMMGNPKILL